MERHGHNAGAVERATAVATLCLSACRLSACLFVRPFVSMSSASSPLILVVEDEPGIASILTAYLERDGLRAQAVGDGPQALRLFRQLRPSLVLLDIHMPGMDGIDVLRGIRDESQVPVIVVSALAGDVDKLLALRLGADDYVVKPFNPPEIVARVRAVLRRTQPGRQASEAIRVGALEIDVEAHSAVVMGAEGRAAPLSLTLTEFRLLAYMAAQPRRCFSREQLIEQCLPESSAMERVVDSHLSKLRRKLELAGQEGLIETVRGIGYRLWPWA